VPEAGTRSLKAGIAPCGDLGRFHVGLVKGSAQMTRPPRSRISQRKNFLAQVGGLGHLDVGHRQPHSRQ